MPSRSSGSTCCSATPGSFHSATRCFSASAPTGRRSSPACYGIRSFEAVLILVTLAAMAAAVPIGFLCVRYVGIFFGMLTLAFGMLFHSFLFKFYHVTGGDSGMRVPRMNILGLEFAQYNKIDFLAGPFYYYCLALLVLAGPGDVAHRAFAVRPAPQSHPGQCAQGRVSRRARAPVSARRLRHLRRLRRHRRRHSRLPHRPRRPGAGLLDPVRDSWCSWRCSAASRTSSARSSARWPSRCCRTSCSR